MNSFEEKIGIVCLIMAISVLIQACTIVHGLPEYGSSNAEPLKKSLSESKKNEAIIQKGPSPKGDHPWDKATGPPPHYITIFPEWENTAYLILAWPLSSLTPSETNDPSEINELYISIVRETAEYVNILILVTNYPLVDKLLSLFKKENLYHFVENGTIDFLVTGVDTKWVQDYGMLFGVDKSGEIYLLDTIYHNMKLGPNFRENDDNIPAQLQNWFRKQSIRTHLIRPPLILHGGNFATNGDGIYFTSTETLLDNGGNEDDVNLIFEKYFGARKVIYLKPLPGPTVKHIDMFFKIINNKTFILGQYDVSSVNNPNWYWQKKAKKVLDDNEKIIRETLKESYSDLKILRMPMPDIISENKEEKEKDIKKGLEICGKEVENYLDTKAWKKIWLPPDLPEADKQLLEEIYSILMYLDIPNKKQLVHKIELLGIKKSSGDYGILFSINLKFQGVLNSGNIFSEELQKVLEDEGISLSKSAITRVLRKDSAWKIIDKASTKTYEIRKEKGKLNIYGLKKEHSVIKMDIEDVQIRFLELCGELLDYSEREIVLLKSIIVSPEHYDYYYPTYLNSTFIKSGNKQILLVPRYSNFEDKETKVISIFQQFYPNAKIIFINCNHIITQQGAIHCISTKIPKIQQFELSRK